MNSISFTPQQVERKLHLKLLEYFDEFNQDNDSRYVEVHIMNDGFCTILEWEVVPYNHEYGGQFKYVDEEHEPGDEEGAVVAEHLLHVVVQTSRPREPVGQKVIVARNQQHHGKPDEQAEDGARRPCLGEIGFAGDDE